MIKILVAHFGPPNIIAGAEIAIADMIDKGSGQFHYIMLTPGEGRLADFYRDRGYEVWARNIHTKRRKYPGLHSIQSYFFAKTLQRENIDIVLCNDTPAASKVGTACRFANIPHVIYVRTELSDKEIHRKLLQSADGVFAVSKAVFHRIKDLCDPAKVNIVHDHFNGNAIMDRIEAHRVGGNRLLPFSSTYPVVGIIGRLQSIKQQDLFLRSIPRILLELPETRFIIVGSAKENEKCYENMLHNLAKELNIKDKVIFMGHRDDAIEILSELTLCCVTSSQDAFPRAILEAQLVGCPIISANVGGCPEMVEDGVTGLLFSSTSADSESRLASQVIRLLQDEQLRMSLRKQAKARILETFATLEPVRRFEENLIAMARL